MGGTEAGSFMRFVDFFRPRFWPAGLALAAFTLLAGVSAQPTATAAQGAFASPDGLLEWVYAYRKRPQPQALPQAVLAMRSHGLLTDPDKGAFFTGFLAGALGQNPRAAEAMVAQWFPMPPKEQGVIVKAIAHSGLPDWRGILERSAAKMPERHLLIDDFLTGKTLPVMEAEIESEGTANLYTLWGLYVATGDTRAVEKIIPALRWSIDENDSFRFKDVLAAVGLAEDRSDITRLTVGSTAKWTLASYAERNRELVTLYRIVAESAEEDVATPLNDVIAAAERFEAERIRTEQLAIIDEANRKNFAKGTKLSRAASAGQVGIATACVAATASGLPEIAVPCVIGGAVYSGAVKLFGQ
jgi:hypothetical protein